MLATCSNCKTELHRDEEYVGNYDANTVRHKYMDDCILAVENQIEATNQKMVVLSSRLRRLMSTTGQFRGINEDISEKQREDRLIC